MDPPKSNTMVVQFAVDNPIIEEEEEEVKDEDVESRYHPFTIETITAAATTLNNSRPPRPPDQVDIYSSSTTNTNNHNRPVVALASQTVNKTNKSSSANSSTNSSSLSSLTHLQNHWPGQTGSGCHHLDVRPITYYDLLSTSNQQIIIPLFQRRYCWTSNQIHKWFHDLVNSTARSSGGGSHSTHKTMFKRVLTSHDNEKNQNDNDTTSKPTTPPTTSLICIDGQQRITTTTIFLIALRGIYRSKQQQQQQQQHRSAPSSPQHRLLEKIDTILFSNSTSDLIKMQHWVKEYAIGLIQQQQQERANNNQLKNKTMPPPPSRITTCYNYQMELFDDGWLPPSFHTTLVPSYIDRSAYYEILLHEYIHEALVEQLQLQYSNIDKINVVLNLSPNCQNSNQYMTYHIFKTELAKLLATKETKQQRQHPSSSSTFTTSTNILEHLYHRQMIGFTLMYIELLANDNIQQIFLWMQEKTIFGMGRLLFNPHPGIDFTPIDLARNLLLSSVMNISLEEQVEFYKYHWIYPLEMRFTGRSSLSKIMHSFVNRIDQEYGNNRYKGDMEERLEQYKAAVPVSLQKTFENDTPMMIYGRFHSYVQHRAIMLTQQRRNSTNTSTATASCGSSATEISTKFNDIIITPEVADSIVQELVQEGENIGL